MNCAHTINVNHQPYNNARRPVVMSNRPQFERFGSMASNDQQQRKGFTRLHSNDRRIYEALVEIAESENKYTSGEVRNMIDNMLNGDMHVSMRKKLENLISDLTRQNLEDMLNDYEDLLCKIAPAIMPNESKDAYAARTNLPEYVVDETFNRGDTETF